MIHSLQLAQRALWSKSSRIPTTGVRLPGVERTGDRVGRATPGGLSLEPGAYTVSVSAEGEDDLDDGAAAATTDESCWNHRERARRDTASTSLIARGIGIWVSHELNTTHFHHDVIGGMRPIACSTKSFTLDAQVPGRAHSAMEPRPDDIL